MIRENGLLWSGIRPVDPAKALEVLAAYVGQAEHHSQSGRVYVLVDGRAVLDLAALQLPPR